MINQELLGTQVYARCEIEGKSHFTGGPSISSKPDFLAFSLKRTAAFRSAQKERNKINTIFIKKIKA